MSRRLLIFVSAMSVLAAVLTGAALIETSAPRHGSTTTPTASQPTATGCTPVELHPGYPGYRGFVTGLNGPGEAACLEELTRLYAWFDRDHEDTENVAAARRLGLAGDASTWVWENWLAVEAERGMTPNCYLFAYRQISQGVAFRHADVAWTDPRLMVGNIGSVEWIGRVSASIDVGAWQLGRMFPTDYQLRAMAWATSNRDEINADELRTAAKRLARQLFSGSGGNGIPYVVGRVWEQGGYAWVPDNACPDDQVFIAMTTVETMAASHPGVVVSAYVGQLKASGESWKLEYSRGSDQSFRDYLIAHDSAP